MSDVTARSNISATNSSQFFYGYVELKELKEYHSFETLQRSQNGLFRISTKPTIFYPEWFELPEDMFKPVSNVYIYIFRKTGNYTTLYDEYYANNDGNYLNYDVTDERRENGFEDAQIRLPLIDEGRQYTYYIFSSPFRISYKSIHRIRNMITEKSILELDKFFAVCGRSSFNDHYSQRDCYENNTLKLTVPDYIGYLIVLFKTLELKIKELIDFVNPSSDKAKTIKFFSDFLHNLIVNDDKISEKIKYYDRDWNRIINRANADQFSELFGYPSGTLDSFIIDWANENGVKYTPYRAERDFNHFDNFTYVNWRNNYDLRFKYLEEQIETCANEILWWIKREGLAFAFLNLVYGSHSGLGAEENAVVDLESDYTIDDLQRYIYTEKHFDKSIGSDLFEALIGIIFKKLDETQNGQNFNRDFIKTVYNEMNTTSQTYPDYYEMLEENRDTDFSVTSLMKSSFKLTKDLSGGIADFLNTFSIHIVTDQFREIKQSNIFNTTTRIMSESLTNVSETLFKNRSIVISEKSDAVSIGYHSRDLDCTLIDIKMDEIETTRIYNEFEITVTPGVSEDNIRRISKFSDALDKINIGLGVLQLLSICAKDEHNILDLLDVADFCLDLYGLLGNAGKLGTKVLGAAGAAIGAASSIIQATNEARQGDYDSSWALGISAGGSVIALVGIIAGAIVTAPVWGVVAIIGAVIAAVAGIISIFLDDSSIELAVANCCWGIDYPNHRDRTTDWSIIPLNQWSQSKPGYPTWVGDVETQIKAITNIYYDYKIDEIEFVSSLPEREPEPFEYDPIPFKPAGVIYFKLKPKLLQRSSNMDVSISLIDRNDQTIPNSTYSFTLSAGTNLFYNLYTPQDKDPTILSADEKLETISCLVAAQKNARANEVCSFIKMRVFESDQTAISCGRIPRQVNHLSYLRFVEESNVDYYELWKKQKEQRNRTFLKITTKLYINGKQANPDSYIEKSDSKRFT